MLSLILFEILLVIIMVAVFASISAAGKKGSSINRSLEDPTRPPIQAGRPASRPQQRPVSRAGSQARPYAKPSGAPEKVKVGGRSSGSRLLNQDSVFLEDRNNDWLARQLREEARIMRSADMLDLGAGHRDNCDADRLKRIHLFEHDDSIDNGEL